MLVATGRIALKCCRVLSSKLTATKPHAPLAGTGRLGRMHVVTWRPRVVKRLPVADADRNSPSGTSMESAAPGRRPQAMYYHTTGDTRGLRVPAGGFRSLSSRPSYLAAAASLPKSSCSKSHRDGSSLLQATSLSPQGVDESSSTSTSESEPLCLLQVVRLSLTR